MRNQPLRRNRSPKRYSVIVGVLTIFAFNSVFTVVEVRSAGNLQDFRSRILKRCYPLVADSVEASAPVSSEALSDAVLGLLDDPVFHDLRDTFDDPELGVLTESLRRSGDPAASLAVLGIIERSVDGFEIEQERSFDILFFLYFSLAAVLLFYLLFSEYENQKVLSDERSRRTFDKKLIGLLEQERNLLSLELHDDVAQKLSVLKQHFSPINDAAGHTEVLHRYASELIDSIRSLAGRLRSPDLSAASLAEQLEMLFSDFRGTSEIDLDSRLSGLKPLIPDQERDSHVYRIVQELLSNCRRHSGAGKAELTVLYTHPYLKILYRDDGVGFRPEDPTDGLGMKGIDYRLDILRGNCLWKTQDADGRGTECRIVVPVAI